MTPIRITDLAYKAFYDAVENQTSILLNMTLVGNILSPFLVMIKPPGHR